MAHLTHDAELVAEGLRGCRRSAVGLDRDRPVAEAALGDDAEPTVAQDPVLRDQLVLEDQPVLLTPQALDLQERVRPRGVHGLCEDLVCRRSVWQVLRVLGLALALAAGLLSRPLLLLHVHLGSELCHGPLGPFVCDDGEEGPLRHLQGPPTPRGRQRQPEHRREHRRVPLSHEKPRGCDVGGDADHVQRDHENPPRWHD
mmetsp:Transcript_31030/g.92172  ORF Transcript_31030/g.92172 Transcript_31030/m.92172 type:complete len:200 (-) Transcript_31030:12-611(-)